MNTEPERLAYSPQEVAGMLFCTRQAVYRLMREGKLRYVRITERTIRIHRDDVEALFRATVQQNGA